MKLNPYIVYTTVAAMTALTMTFGLPGKAEAKLSQDEKVALSKELTTLFRSARAAISANQDHINNPDIGDKGLTAEKVLSEVKANYKKATSAEFKPAGGGTAQGQATQAMLDAVVEIMKEAQPLINEKGKGFKGFLPAVFARQVAEKFSDKMTGKMAIKLTAPAEYVRNRKNRPDEWESQVIEGKFRAAGYEKGKAYSEQTDHKGKTAYRYILPEYYAESCLSCHGTPKGELDITGGAKEGAALGDLGGAISFAIYD